MTLQNTLETPEQLADYLQQTMVRVEGGSFEMGQPDPNIDGEGYSNDEQPVHTVTLDSFYLCKYPVTQALYQAVTGKNPSRFSHNPKKLSEFEFRAIAKTPHALAITHRTRWNR